MVTRRQQARSDDDDDPETEGLIGSNINNNNHHCSKGTTTTRRTISNNSDDSYPTGVVSSSTGRQRIPSSDSTEIAELNLDHLTNRKVRVVSSSGTNPKSSQSISSSSPSLRKGKKFYKTYYGRTVSISEYCRSHVSMLCYYYPYTCGCMVMLALIVVMIVLASLMLNPLQEYGVIEHDYTNIKSIYDVQIGKINHWCLGGGNDDCICEDPTVPIPRPKFKSWIEAFKSNRKLVKRFIDKVESSNLDVAFVGESIVEEIDGRWMGIRNRSEGLRNLETIFHQHFRKKLGNSTHEGVALGIAGDTSPNVLFRLLHGEMPDYFQPKVWWLSLGNNDLGRTGCSEEVVVIGILRVVEEILNRRQNAHVVINSLFPMTTTRGGQYPVISDYEDSFIRLGNGRDLRTNLRRTKKPKSTQPPTFTDDTDMSAEAEKEEGLRDEEAKNVKSRMHQPQSKPNPIMLDDITKSHKYKVGVPLVKQNDKPLWTSIRAINKELKKFAGKNADRVTFFDATELFAKKLDSNKYQLLTDRISDRGHPTEDGFRVWEDAIVVQLEHIVSIMKQDQPELFKPVSTWNSGGDMSNVVPKDTGDVPINLIDDEVALLKDDDFDTDILYKNNDDYKNDGRDKEEEDGGGGKILIDPDDNNNSDDDVDTDTNKDILIVSPATNQPNSDDDDPR